MIITPGLTGIPRIGPNGGIVIRSALAGPLVEVGAVGGGGSPIAFRSQFEEGQAQNPETAEDIIGAAVTYLNVPAGAYVFVQCVLNLGGNIGDGFCNSRALWEGTTLPEEVIWEPGPVVWFAIDESPVFDKLPLQFQTPELVAPQASLTVKIQSNGQGDIMSGHFQAELILP